MWLNACEGRFDGFLSRLDPWRVGLNHVVAEFYHDTMDLDRCASRLDHCRSDLDQFRSRLDLCTVNLDQEFLRFDHCAEHLDHCGTRGEPLRHLSWTTAAGR